MGDVIDMLTVDEYQLWLTTWQQNNYIELQLRNEHDFTVGFISVYSTHRK